MLTKREQLELSIMEQIAYDEHYLPQRAVIELTGTSETNINWFSKCMSCGEQLQAVRPGKVQCPKCG